MLFISRRQKFGEDYASLELKLKKLSQLSYPECLLSVRDKMTCAQFVMAISDNFVRSTFQLKKVSSLAAAIEREKVIKAIQEENFERKRMVNWRNFDKNKNFVKYRRNEDKREEK